MRILVDMQGAQNMSRDRGIGRYVRAFAKAFLSIAKDKHDIYFLLNNTLPHTHDIVKEFNDLMPLENILSFDALSPTAYTHAQNTQNSKISELLREKFIEDISPDCILLGSLFEGMWDESVTSIGQYTHTYTTVIFYDLIPYIQSEKYFSGNTDLKNWYMDKFHMLQKADSLLCISDSAHSEARIFTGWKYEKMTTIYAAIDPSFQPIPVKKEVLEQYNIFKPFILLASAYEARKNFEGLIQAFSLLSKPLSDNYSLVLVCKLTKRTEKYLEKVIHNFEVKDKVILTGFVPDDHLKILYNAAELFVFPSRHEGFGLPPLEAMACGTATIASDSSSLPEVIGYEDALFDAAIPQAIADKISEVLSNDDFKKSLEAHARVQASKFSWEKTAKRALIFLENDVARDTYKNHKKHTLSIEKKIDALCIDTKDAKSLLKKAYSILEQNNKRAQDFLQNAYHPSFMPKWRIEGPFDSSYSLALLNRETAQALDALGFNVSLHSTEGPGDFDPDPSFLEQNPNLARMHRRANELPPSSADIQSRNLYPPRVDDMQADFKMLHHYAWEESAFPQEWVENFNRSLTAMTCLSKHVEKIMIDNGVTVPLATSGCGVDHWERIVSGPSYRLDDTHTFRFLHVSSCFPRKGADVLLKSYGDAFSSEDDVVLIIKTFSNPHNEIRTWLLDAKSENKNYPDVIIIEEDLTESQLKALYEQCHALASPSRAEGFGLPMAEAMLSGLPVITTAWSGQLDFCTSETAWLIDYTFTPAKTHFNLFNSVWAEPSQEHLAALMREVYALPKEQRVKKSKVGRKRLLETFKWTDVAKRLVAMAKENATSQEKVKPKIGWITSWNTKCGIATYSEHLINTMQADISILAGYSEHLIAEDSSNVYRCLELGDTDSLENLAKEIARLNLDTVVIQFNYSFFNFDNLNRFIEQQSKKGTTIIMMLHATQDAPSVPHKKLKQLVPSLAQCDRLLVHSYEDLNRLKGYGLLDNVALFPHGILECSKPHEVQSNHTFTIASYGFFLPHKGLNELIEALSILIKKNIKIELKMINATYPSPVSTKIIQEAKAKISLLGLEPYITLCTDFLSDEESLSRLSKADLIVFPYQETGESSSAAVRYGLVTEKPIAVTPLAIFDDVSEAVFKLPGTSSDAIAKGIETLMHEINSNSNLIKTNKEAADRWREGHRYPLLSKRLQNMLTALRSHTNR